MPEQILIGGGFGGVATARGLARGGARGVLLLERDPAVGQRASGRNAGMIRTLVADPAVRELAVASARTIAGTGAFRRTGGLLLADGDEAATLAEVGAERGGVREGEEARAIAGGWLADTRFDAAILTESDGVADIHALLHAYLDEARRAGVEVRTGTEVLEILIDGDRVRGVRTAAGEIPAEVVVNAAGAWAGPLGAAATGRTVPLVNRRRHLFTTGAVAGVDPDQPWIWHDSGGWYFRPESGGFLLSGCDESEHPPADPEVDPAEEERLAAKLVRHAPALADLRVRNRWACLRTFAPDRRFVIGWDPEIRGLYWVAGLGGHGVTVSAAVGDLAAREILGDPGAGADSPFSPSRL